MSEDTPKGRHHPGRGSKHVHGLSSQHHLSTIEGDIESGKDVHAVGEVSAGRDMHSGGRMFVANGMASYGVISSTGPIATAGSLHSAGNIWAGEGVKSAGDIESENTVRGHILESSGRLTVEGPTQLNDALMVSKGATVQGPTYLDESVHVRGPLAVHGYEDNETDGGRLHVVGDPGADKAGEMYCDGRVLAGGGYYIVDPGTHYEAEVLSGRMDSITPPSEDPYWQEVVPPDDHRRRIDRLAWRIDQLIKELRKVSLMKS